MMKKNPDIAIFAELEQMEDELEAKLSDKILNNTRWKDIFTPKKGIDYYTEDEKSQLIDYIQSQIRIPKDGESIKGDKGERGDDGKDGRDGKDGKDARILVAGIDYPTEEQLKALIYSEIGALFALKPKEEKTVTKKEVKELVVRVQEKVDFKLHADEIARALETLKGKGQLDYNALKNRPDIPSDAYIDKKIRTLHRGGGGGGVDATHDHTAGAGAAIQEGAITFNDVVTLDVSTTKHGLVPKGTNLGKFLKDDGTWGNTTGLDWEITSATSGIILKSANGTRFRVTITDDGELVTTSL